MAIQEDMENGNSNNNGVHKDVQQPLLRKNLEDNGDGSKEHSNNKESNLMVCFSTFVAVCGSFEFGCCAGYSSPTQDAITEDLSLSIAEYSMFGSILTFVAMIGAITSGPIGDFIGRKGAMRVATAFCVAGWLSIFFAMGALALYIGRLATGYGMGVFSYVVPVIVAKIAPKNLHGALTTLNQLMICSGVSGFYVIGTVLTWRVLALMGFVPCAILLIGLFLIPESPRWLIGREKQFDTALRTLRGKDADISHEAAEIKDYIEILKRLPKAKLLDLFQRRYLRSVIIGVGLMVVQQFGGINGVCFYTSNIFESAGFSATIGTITYAIIQVVVTVLNTTVIDKVSASGLVLACIITAVAFYLKDNNLAVNSVPILTVIGILLYIGSFSAGMGLVPWVVMPEIFPINIKGVAGSLATLVNWLGAWTISFIYNFLVSWSSYGTYILYAAIHALGIVFVVLVVHKKILSKLDLKEGNCW